LITDPWFYAVAVPAVLLLGISKSGFGVGFGALAVPLMALAVPVPQAAAMMLPLLLVMDVLGLAALLKERDRALLRLLLPAGLLGTVAGTLLFGLLSAKAVAGVVGAITLLFLAQRLLLPPRPTPRPPRWRAAGFLLTMCGLHQLRGPCRRAADGFYVLPLKLPPVRVRRRRWRSSSPPSTCPSGCPTPGSG
jgi:uncharacterized membrane protein YfcA